MRVLPVLVHHLLAIGPEPRDVGHAGAAQGPSLEPSAPPECGVSGLQRDQPPRVLEEVAIDVLPVEPGNLVVLAIGVVVALLRTSELVATEQHGNALREKEGGEDVALLARAEGVHAWIVGRPFDAAVPRAVVAL